MLKFGCQSKKKKKLISEKNLVESHEPDLEILEKTIKSVSSYCVSSNYCFPVVYKFT